MQENPENQSKWHHPTEVMKLHKLKLKKKKLQARIIGNPEKKTDSDVKNSFEHVFNPRKRKNPFLVNGDDNKKVKIQRENIEDESCDQTLFKLLHESSVQEQPNQEVVQKQEPELDLNVEIVKAQGEKWLPIDWCLKNKVRLLSEKPFPWNQKLKISEEASGITGFSRCLDINTETKLDTSPNARFHQCCLYWQQPSLPWINLFPRLSSKANQIGTSIATNSVIRESLQGAWSDSLRSLFQLVRTRQCPYFYACANNFTVLFRAAGICGFADVHALITPTTRGFRTLLRQEDIEFTMPLKSKKLMTEGNALENIEETSDEKWLKEMGINAEDIKQINYTQEKIILKAESEIDNSDESLILVMGVDVHALYNFLINCKSATALTGSFAGIPPTLLAPVAFHGATLNSLKIRENKVHVDDMDYHSLEISGPILPTMIHNLFNVNPLDHSVTMTFSNISTTQPFSKILRQEVEDDNTGSVVFGKENLSDCGLSSKVLKHFCDPDNRHITNVECLKFIHDNKTFTWT